jgi:hypothetical protein
MVCHGVCVAALPESPPVIHTEHDRYEPGDTLRANCTSPPSKPAASLSFFLNNIPVSPASFKIHKNSVCSIIYICSASIQYGKIYIENKGVQYIT